MTYVVNTDPMMSPVAQRSYGRRIDLRPERPRAGQLTRAQLDDFSEILSAPMARPSHAEQPARISPPSSLQSTTLFTERLPKAYADKSAALPYVQSPAAAPGMDKEASSPALAAASAGYVLDVERHSPASPTKPRRLVARPACICLLALGTIGVIAGAAVGIYFGTHKNHGDNSAAAANQGIAPATSTSAPGSTATSSSILSGMSTAVSSTSTAHTSTTSASTSAQASSSPLPWAAGTYSVTWTKSLDTCGSYDIGCNSQISDTWYVSQQGGNYNIVSQGNTSQWTVNGQGGATSLNFNLNPSSTSTSDGCLFTESQNYALSSVGSTQALGTNTAKFVYDLDLTCYTTSGTAIGQGNSCECTFDVSAKRQ